MKLDQLKVILEKKFNIVTFIDLADLTVNYSAAYQFFKLVRRDEYPDNSRIVIYSSHHVNDKLIRHLYKTTEFVDVGNWFVLFCTPSGSSEIIKKNCIQDTDTFQHFPVTLDETKELHDNFYLPETFCAIPWHNIEIKQNGVITPCCVSQFEAGNINIDTIDYTFNHKFQNLRNALLSGNKPKECKRCWDTEDQGITSIRQHNVKRLTDVLLTETIINPTIKSLDIKFQNTCNFKCLICGPESSSLHVQEQSKYNKIPITPQLKWSESQQFIDQINELLPSLTNIDMYGGEPFLIKKFSEILKSAVNFGFAKNIRLHYNSNGSVWPGEFIEYWKYFKEVDIHFSIDAIGDKFDYQRGGTWKEVESNILKINDLRLPNLNISIMPSISILSVYYLDEVLAWAKKYDFQLFASHVLDPAALSLRELTQPAIDIINQKFKNSDWDEMQKILESINSAPASDGNKFQEYIAWYDSVRDTNFSDAHLEISNAMQYTKQ
jgi:hypothetical protein